MALAQPKLFPVPARGPTAAASPPGGPGTDLPAPRASPGTAPPARGQRAPSHPPKRPFLPSRVETWLLAAGSLQSLCLVSCSRPLGEQRLGSAGFPRRFRFLAWKGLFRGAGGEGPLFLSAGELRGGAKTRLEEGKKGGRKALHPLARGREEELGQLRSPSEGRRDGLKRKRRENGQAGGISGEAAGQRTNSARSLLPERRRGAEAAVLSSPRPADPEGKPGFPRRLTPKGSSRREGEAPRRRARKRGADALNPGSFDL